MIQIVTAAILAGAVVLATAGTETILLQSVAPGSRPDFAIGIGAVTLGLTAAGLVAATFLPALLTRDAIVPTALNQE